MGPGGICTAACNDDYRVSAEGSLASGIWLEKSAALTFDSAGGPFLADRGNNLMRKVLGERTCLLVSRPKFQSRRP